MLNEYKGDEYTIQYVDSMCEDSKIVLEPELPYSI